MNHYKCQLQNKLINTFESDVKIVNEDKTVNAKSIINIMSMGLIKGSEITVRTYGEDGKAAMDAISNFILNLKE
ncbi:HPr family phosphocarrier protein [Clostridium sp.]|uniref:HPr family phosphocarrier protein n=1 Tax=Clostridium sp. TaxID=1506 RepID=UPI003D6D09CB